MCGWINELMLRFEACLVARVFFVWVWLLGLYLYVLVVWIALLCCGVDVIYYCLGCYLRLFEL